MIGTEITLAQMLSRREARAHEQQLLLTKYHAPLISFCMNIPGPIKTNEAIRKAFDTGKYSLFNALENNSIVINHCIELHEQTGDELLLSVNSSSPDELKNLCMEIENASKLGRLFDFDVIDAEGNKLSRKTFRTCLICNKQAQECARSRAHSVKEMQDAVEAIIAYSGSMS